MHRSRFLLTVRVSLTHTGRAVRLVQRDGRPVSAGTPDPGLVELLRKGRGWWDQLQTGTIDIATIAREEEVNDSWLSRIVRLNFLAPALVEAILRPHPAGLADRRILARRKSAYSLERADRHVRHLISHSRITATRRRFGAVLRSASPKKPLSSTPYCQIGRKEKKGRITPQLSRHQLSADRTMPLKGADPRALRKYGL